MDNPALTETTYYILLSLYHPRHGYGIMQETQQLSGGRVRLAADFVIPRSEATWESPATGYVFAGSDLLSNRVLRDCRVASLLAMTSRRCLPF